MLTQRPHFPDQDSLWQFGRLATPIWVFDVDNHCVWWANRAGLAFWRAETLDALRARDFSGDSANVRTRLRQIVDTNATGSTVTDTWTLYPCGQPRTAVITLQPVVIEDGGNALLVEINRILDMSGEEEALRMLEAIRTAALMVSTFSAQGQLLAQNPEAQAVYGPPGGPRTDLDTRLADRDLVPALIAAVMENRTFDQECEVRGLYAARRHRIVARRGRDPVSGDDIIVLTEEDVTEAHRLRRELEHMNAALEAKVAERTESLRRIEERYELATRAAAIWDWQADDNTLFVSPRLAETLGYDTETFRAMVASQHEGAFLPKEDCAAYRAALIAHLKSPGETWEHDVRLLAAGGAPRWFNLRGIAVAGADGRTVRSVGLMTDISRHKELEATLFAAQRMEAVGRLTGGVAHDFNNLLTVIGGNAELLDLGGEVDHDLTGSILQAVARGAQLTRHLLAYSRKQPLNPRSVDVGELMTTLRHNLFRVLGDAIEVEVSLAPDLWPVYADPSQIDSAVLNIALNARDAMPGGGTLRVSCANLTVGAQAPDGYDLEPGDYVEFRIVDTGSGMTEAALQHAFEPFFTTKEVGKGSGLGLSMVFGFSRQSGGDVRLESRYGAGCTVAMCLPRAGVAAERGLATPALTVSGRGERILLLEDDPPVQRTLRRMLQSLGYRVDCASDLSEARALLDDRPDLCLLDVVLRGGESGFELAETARRQHPGLPVVMMSGYPDNEEDGAAQRFDAFLQKPVAAPVLSRTLGRLLLGVGGQA